MKTLKQRREGVKERLESQLLSGVKQTKEGEKPLEDTDTQRIKREISLLGDRIAGKKKAVKVVKVGEVEEKKDKWFIDIFSISLGTTKHSERRKNKGKSRKKMRKTRSVSFFKSVVCQPGLIQAYREGRMGISPRSHSFRLRKDEPMFS